MPSANLDDLDRKIIHALYVDGRMPFSRLAKALGCSEQTVARRYQRLRDDNVVRVVGQLDSQRLGRSDWAVRIRCAPDAATPVAEALAKRPDTSWVQLMSGGTEIFCAVRSSQDHSRVSLLLEQLPASRRIVDLEAHWLLRVFTFGSSFPGTLHLSDEEVSRLRAGRSEADPVTTDNGTEGPAPKEDLQPSDWPLIQILAEDGRYTFRQIAGRIHWHESTVARRIEQLSSSGVLYFDLDVAPEALGLGARAVLWMAVAPAHLMAVGQQLAEYREVPFAAATTGSTNLMASLSCSDDYALFEFMTKEIASFEGVTRVETSPVIRSVKMHATLVV